MNLMSRIAALAAVMAVVVQPTMSSAADRVDRVTSARAFVTERCLMSPARAGAAQYDETAQESLLVVALAGVAASFVGDLASAGVTALANGIDSASQEAGFVAEGRTSFYFNRVLPASTGSPTGSVIQRPSCLVLYLPSTAGGDLTGLRSDPQLLALNGRASDIGSMDLFSDDGATATTAMDRLISAGITVMPAVYIEAEIIPRREGMVVRPVFVWYRERLPNAPTRSTKTEFHATFATPAASATGSEIGTVFATARMTLPEMTPGTLLDWSTLGANTSLIVPARPRAGLVETTAQSYATAYALLGTRRAETAVADRAAAAAARRYSAAQNAANEELKTVADENLRVARAAQATAQGAVDALTSVNMGATNVQARFVAIRDANKFGQALATALRARSAAVGTSVTNSLQPPQPGTAGETAYVQAEANLSAKQRELDTANAGSDASVIARLNDEMRVLQAKLNEAAVAARRPLPYPNLL